MAVRGADRPSPAAVPRVVGVIPPRPVAYVDRAAVTELAGSWDAGRRVAVLQAVTGGAGVGKTQAAAAYARDRATAGWRLVAWVAAETRDQVLSGLAEVAAAVGVADADNDSDASARNLRRYLETQPGPALMVFDNATDADALSVFLPSVGAVHVVITSTDRSFSRLGMTIDVGLFTPGQAVAYLSQRTGLADVEGAAVVAEELGCLPLALAQAASVIDHEGLDYGTYLRRLRATPAARYLARHSATLSPRGRRGDRTSAAQC